MAELAKARVLAGMGKTQESESLLKELLLREPNHPDAHAQLGELLLAGSKTARSDHHLARAEELERAEIADGGNELHHIVDLLLLRSGREEECLRFARAESKERRDVATCDRLSQALLKSGRAHEAAAASADVLRTGYDDPNFWVHAADARLAALGNITDTSNATKTAERSAAVELLRRALDRSAALKPMTALRARELWQSIEANERR